MPATASNHLPKSYPDGSFCLSVRCCAALPKEYVVRLISQACRRAGCTFAATLPSALGRACFCGFSATSCLALSQSSTPTVFADFPAHLWPAQRHGMDRRSACRVRRLVDVLCDSTCSVAADNLDAGKLLLTETFVELLQDRFTMAVSHPYNGVGVMVCDNRDVFCCASWSYRYRSGQARPAAWRA